MTNEENIKDLLSKGESDQVEFKETYRKEVIGKVICSFLNHKGGQLIVGVTDKKKIVGIANAGKRKVELEQYLLNEIIPEAPVMVSIESFGKKEFLLIKVYAGSKRPYLFNGTIFYRNSSATVQASSKDIFALIHDRKISDDHWERQTVLGVELRDLDIEEIDKTIIAAENENKIRSNLKQPLDFLSYYGLYQNDCFTNGAVILFAKEPVRFIPQARIRLSVLRDGKTGSRLLDDQILEGNIFSNIDLIQKFLKKHLILMRNFTKKNWEREDDYIIPLEALREGILNAIVHRDYSNISSSASILVYPDRVEITNYGKLPFKPEELTKNHLSIPINPDIAQIVFLRGYIEKIGRGTLKIIESCNKAHLKKPSWTTDSNSVKLTFIINSKNEGVTEGGKENKIEEVIEGVTEGVTEGVKNKITALLLTISNNEGNRIPFLTKQLSESEKNIERYIKQLREYALIEYKGSTKTGGYYLTTKIKQRIK
jgi:ATP-dependent DNA helicase RecG